MAPRKKLHLRLVRGGQAAATNLPPAEIGADNAAAADVIDTVVTTLTTLVRGAGIEMALKVGEIVVEGIYGGDLKALRDRGSKDTSFRKLSAHPRLPFSPVTLWRSVAVYELVQRMPGLAKTKHLGVAHLRAALGLPQSVQEHLLRSAEIERWTKDRLENQAARYRKKEKSKRGRRPMPPAIRYVRQLDRLTRKEDASVEDLDLGDLDDTRRLDVEKRIDRIRAWCSAVERALARRDEGEGPEPRLETAG